MFINNTGILILLHSLFHKRFLRAIALLTYSIIQQQRNEINSLRCLLYFADI